MTEAARRIRHRFPFLAMFLIALLLGGEYFFAIFSSFQLQLAMPDNGSRSKQRREDDKQHALINSTLQSLNANQSINEQRLYMLEQQIKSLQETLSKRDVNMTQQVQTQQQTMAGLGQRLDSVEERLSTNNGSDTTDWIKGLTKSLVTIQLAESKTSHYESFVKPSWKRLAFDPQTSHVVADLFIACHPNVCHVIDESCIEINPNNITRKVLENRPENELLCFYAAVPEKENERYRFIHSLNFLEMEPFNSILDLDYYDYILRCDADSILFPGLLAVAPTVGDGWVGDGFYGTKLTDYLVQRYTRRFMPDLGPPLRPNQTTPSMQSTFYIHKSKFRQFVSVVLRATRTLHDKAFTKEVCKEINQLDISKKLHPKEKGDNFCKWAYWHQGVSSLYGTRVAVDHVLENVTVTTSLDAMSSELSRYDVTTTVQAHLLSLKHIVAGTLARGDSDLCSRPIETLQKFGKEGSRGEAKEFYDAMEKVYKDSELATSDTLHYVADVLFHHFHRKACLQEATKGSRRRLRRLR